MKLVSFRGGFGRLEGDLITPMGSDLCAYLSSGAHQDVDAVPADTLDLAAPIPRSGKVICIGLNYRDHAREAGMEEPAQPVLFPKFHNSVVGDGEPVRILRGSAHLD